MSDLATITNKYNLPVRIYTWYRHEEGVRHSYFEKTDIEVLPNSSSEELSRICELIEQTRSKFLGLSITSPSQLKTLHPICA